MAASMLNVNRTELLVHEGSKGIYRKYYTPYATETRNVFYWRVKFEASPELTLYAKDLVISWLKTGEITFGMRDQTVLIGAYFLY